MKRALASAVVITAGSFAFATLPTESAPSGVANKTLLFINGYYYQPFSSTLPAGTKVYMDADASLLRATQRSLGFREVDYKKLFFNSLTFSGVKPDTDANGNTVYNYGTLSTSTTLAGYWTKKNLPIISGVDGNGYITDGHHTTAGYLATAGQSIIADKPHIVLGTTMANPSLQTAVNEQMWSDFAAANNAYLYGPTGNQLAQLGDTGYSGLLPLLPPTTAMPTTPDKASMTNDLYRSLAWGAVDAVVKTATNASGTKLSGFSKVDSTSSLSSKPDVNFVEFYWGDFLRNRVNWNDDAAVTSANLINAPVSFFAATANAIALAKSEVYTDSFGRSLVDYTGSEYSQNTRTWANASLLNGLAVSGDTYNMFLTDDATIQGDILPSAVDGVVNKLSINTQAGMTLTGAVQNFTSIAVNNGGTMTINWKDAAVNALSQNTVLAVTAGTASVTLSGNNDFSKLSTLVVGAGSLTLNTSNSVSDQVIWGDISGAGKLRKLGFERLTLTGANTISGGVFLDEGALVLGSASVMDGAILKSSPVGTGSLWMKDGTTLGFEESARLLNAVNVVPLSGGVGVTIDLGDNAVEFAGAVTSIGSLTVSGQQTSVLTISGTSQLSGNVALNAVTLRLSNATGIAPEFITLNGSATIQSGSDTVLSSELRLVDDGRLDSGESLFEVIGNITGDGRLTIAGHPFGTVRLSGLNTYTGGTTVDQSRVEVGQGGEDDASGAPGSGRAFGTGTVELNSGVLGFAVSANLPNDLVLAGKSTVDVGSFSAALTGGLSGSGSFLVTGTREGSLLFAPSSNLFTGATSVEGTTLRILSSAGNSVFGDNDQPLTLNDARLLITPDLESLGTTGDFGSRAVVLGPQGGILDANDNDIAWSGVISGFGKLSVGASYGNAVELAADNLYKGGTEIIGGGNVVFSKDANLGDASGAITFTQGGLVYGGDQDLTLSRSIRVSGSGLIDMGSRNVTVSGAVSGAGVLEVGRTDSSGSLIVGSSSQNFAGTVVLAGGVVSVTHADALKGATLEIPTGGGSVSFTTSEASLGGLAGNGALLLPDSFKLSIGSTGKTSTYVGALSGSGVILTKAGAGKFTIGGSADVASAVVSGGALALDATGSLSSTVKLTLGRGASLSVVGTHDLTGNFNLSNLDLVSAESTIVFNGPSGSELRLPKAVADKVGLMNLGAGKIVSVSATGETVNLSSSATNKLVATSEVTVSSVTTPITVANGAKITLDTSAGVVKIQDFAGLTGGGTSTSLVLPSDGVLTFSGKLSGFTGSLVTDGTVNVPSAVGSTPAQLMPVKGSASINVASGGSLKFSSSPEYTGTTTLAAGSIVELTGSLNKDATLSLSASAVVKVNPVTSGKVTLPSLSGDGGSVSLNSGSLEIQGSSANFGGALVVEKGVLLTVKGDLPKGLVTLKDASVPMKVDTSSGNISLPGIVGGNGSVALSGTGKVTMTSTAAILTSELKIGTSSVDRPTLDVSQLSNGLVLAASQSLAGGGTIMGSVTAGGAFRPGNSPGLFTVAKSTVQNPDGTYKGGDLVLAATSSTQIEYGLRSDGVYKWDQVVLGGTLQIATGARVSVKAYAGTDSNGTVFVNSVTPASLRMTGVFTAQTLNLGAVVPELDGAPYMFSARWVQSGAATLDILIEKANYGSKVSAPRLQSLGYYLSSASYASPSSSIIAIANVLDASADQAQLEAALQALSSPVYAEAQRVSLRRSAAISETVQRRLSPSNFDVVEGWSAWNETYGWSFHRNSSDAGSSWNANTFGDILGVQNTRGGLTLGILGSTGHSSATLSSPGSGLKADSYHGGVFGSLNLGGAFVDTGFLAGSADQSVTRDVNFNGLGGTGRAKFQSSEYSVYLRGGLKLKDTAGKWLVTPSLAVMNSGVRQDGAAESGAGGASVSTDSKSANSWQSRVGTELSRKFKVSTRDAEISSSVHWVHDFSGRALSSQTRFNDVPRSLGTFESAGSRMGADAFELGLGASLGVSERTSVRVNGNWQIRDGCNQPGASFGVNVRF